MNDSPRVLGNRYEVGDLLGRGGMAEVHLGRDTRLGRVVAIKLLRTDLARDPIFQARFRREAQSAASLNHPAIVSVYDTGEEQLVEPGGSVIALPYIVMEYVEGRTLRELLVNGQPVELGLALEVTSGVLSALDYSHRAGIVHRDIKPANVMLTPAGDIKVMDFGIARALADASATMTATQAVIGTAQYLSPEQARGETVDARSDLYSAGCLLFELVTGRPPFVADSPVAVAYQHVREAPPRPSDLNPAIPENLDRVILHSLAKDRESRYQTASEFKADVDNVRSGRQVLAPVPAPGSTRVDDPRVAAATEYYGQAPAGTRALPPMTNGGGFSGGTGGYGYADYGDPAAGNSMLPGAPSTTETQYATRRDANGHSKGRGGGRRGFGWVLLGIAVLAVFGVIAYGVSNFVGGTTQTQKVKVPLVKGLSQDVATKTLTDLKLKVSVTPQASDTIPEKIVIDQDPANSTVVEGTTVVLTVSTGSGTAQVPDVSNYTQDQARAAIEAVGLKAGSAEPLDDNPNVQKDHIVKTDPVALANVPKGQTVKLFISTGQVTVPDLKGKKLQDALKLLQDKRIFSTQNAVQSDQPEGTVLNQSITANTKVEAGTTTITLDVASPQPSPSPTPTDQPPTDQPPPPTDQPSPGQT